MIILAILLTLIVSALGFYFWQRHLRRTLEKEHALKQKIVEEAERQKANSKKSSNSESEEWKPAEAADPISTPDIREPQIPKIDWTTTLSTLHQQIGKLGVDFLNARHLTSVCHDDELSLSASRMRISDAAQLPRDTSDYVIKQALFNAGEAFVARQRLTEKLLEGIGPTKTACLQAKDSWEALATTLKQLEHTIAETQVQLPFSAVVAITAAKSMTNQTESQLKKDTSKALVRKEPTPLPKGPSSKTLLPQVKSLVPTLQEVLESQTQVEQCRYEANSLTAQVDNFKKVHIAEPVKPTTEEVERYLRELRQWAASRLAAERTASASIHKFAQAVDAFKVKLDELRSIVNKVSPLIHKQLDERILAEIAGAYKLTKELEKSHAIFADNLIQFLRNQFTKTDPVTTVSATEADALDKMQTLARTLGFAVAQRNVAVRKYKSANATGFPSYPEKPTLQTGFTLDKHLQAFEAYLKGVEKVNEDTELVKAEIAVYTSALNARREKVDSSKEALSELTQETAKLVDDATSDDIRIAVAAAAKLCDAQYYANHWEQLTKR